MGHKIEDLQSTVISTRIRLARNLEDYPFPKRLTESQSREVTAIVRHALRQLDDYWQEYDVRTVGTVKAMLLQESHLVSPTLVESGRGSVFISSDEKVSVMVNEEDHLREQYIVKGFDLASAYERISSLDDGIGRFTNFAYDEKLGFLTACPSNVGTGLRASVMMFLPALERCGKLSAFVKTWSECALTVRGVFGEGTASEGYVYQISNDKTLGLSEAEILDYTHSAVTEIAAAEIQERKRWLAEEGDALRDRALRAYGILTNCYTLEYREMRELLTSVRLGLALGFFHLKGEYTLDDLIDSKRPYSFCAKYDLFGAEQAERDRTRAEVMRERLMEILDRN